MTTVASINKGTSRSVGLLAIVQKLFWLSVEFGFKLTAAYLPGHLNILSDWISRLHEVDSAWEAKELLSTDLELESNGHISYEAYLWLQTCWGMSSTV
jgi:hypothetical protein